MSLSVIDETNKYKPSASAEELISIKAGLKVSFIKKVFAFEEGQGSALEALKDALDNGKFAMNVDNRSLLYGDDSVAPPLPNVFDTEMDAPPQTLFSDILKGSPAQMKAALVVLKKWFDEAEADVEPVEEADGWGNATADPYANFTDDKKAKYAAFLLKDAGVNLGHARVKGVLVNFMTLNGCLSNKLVSELVAADVVALVGKISQVKNVATQNVFTNDIDKWIAHAKSESDKGISGAPPPLSFDADFKQHLINLEAPDQLLNYLITNGLRTPVLCHKAMNGSAAVNGEVMNLLFVQDDDKNNFRQAGFMAIMESAMEPIPLDNCESKNDSPPTSPRRSAKVSTAGDTSMTEFYSISGKSLPAPACKTFNLFHKKVKSWLPQATPALTMALLELDLQSILYAAPYLTVELAHRMRNLDGFVKKSKEFGVLKTLGQTKFTLPKITSTEKWLEDHNFTVEVQSSTRNCLAALSAITSTAENAFDTIYKNVCQAIFSVANTAYEITINAQLNDEKDIRQLVQLALAQFADAMDNALIDTTKEGTLDALPLVDLVMSVEFKNVLSTQARAKVMANFVILQDKLTKQMAEQKRNFQAYEKKGNNKKRRALEEAEGSNDTKKTEKGRPNFAKIMYTTKQTLNTKEKIPLKSMPVSITSLFDKNTCMTCVCGGVHGIEHFGFHNSVKKITPSKVKAKIKDPAAFKALY